MKKSRKRPVDLFNLTYPVGTRVRVQWEPGYVGQGEIVESAVLWAGDTVAQVKVASVLFGQAGEPMRHLNIDRVLGPWED